MLEHFVELCLEVLIPICELMGIFVIAISTAGGFWHYVKNLFTKDRYNVKVKLAKGMALSLEFKMASEILKTVIVRDLEELLVLGIVIVLRALLSLLIHFEMKQE